MKFEQEHVKREFLPITITLETPGEASFLAALVGGTNPDLRNIFNIPLDSNVNHLYDFLTNKLLECGVVSRPQFGKPEIVNFNYKH